MHMENDLNNILIAFVTGLTSGGLSCLAVQGGLLASSLENQIEKDFQNPRPKRSKSKKKVTNSRSKLALPILVFLLAKLLAYSILGLLLGWVGQAFQLSPIARAALQIGIGVFMLGSALRMLNVHPIFRFFVFEPPAFLRRLIRKKAKEADKSTLVTPAFLGFMTVLIPCGVAQAMMAVALGTGNPLQGAALMFAFTLGTSPVFFAVSYFATQLGQRLEKYFMRIVATVVLVLALVTINSGLTLAGSPFSLSRMFALSQSSGNYDPNEPPPLGIPRPPGPTPEGGAIAPTQISSANLSGIVTVKVENFGYTPNTIHVKGGLPFQLELVTNDVRSCSRAFVIPALGIQKILDSTGVVTINIPSQEQGARISFSCSMGMYGGLIIFDL